MSIEAMKQALEALEYAMEYNRCDDLSERIKQTELRAEPAITSLRQALSEAQLSVNENSHAIEQAEKQEPFGYLWPTERHPEFRFTQQLRDGVEGTPVYTAPQPQEEHHAKDCALLQIPSRDCDCVPTTQREWVDLTPTDIADALGPCPKYFSEWTDADVIYFARTLDAKLKELNHVN